MLYYHLGKEDDQWAERSGMCDPDSPTCNNNVESHFREVSLRYGEDLVSTAAYVDDAGWIAYQYDPPWELWNKAIKAGNPNAPAGFSQNWGPCITPFSDLQITDGRGRKPTPAPKYMYLKEGQFEDLFPAFWGHLDGWISKEPYNGKFPHTPPYSTEDYINIFKTMDNANIPVTFNLLITSDVTRERPFFNPVCVEIMRQVKQAIKGDTK